MMTNHYDKIAAEFNEVWKFSEDYTKWVVERIGYYLRITQHDIFVDIGGGTGTFTNGITEKYTPYKSYCIEPEKKMCDIAKQYINFETICSDAFYFINNLQYKYSKILFKEVVHHIKDREKLWGDIYSTIEKNGRLLIFTRPQNIKFPLFKKAKEAFYMNQPDYNLIAKELKDSGFNVEISNESYIFTLSKEKWHNMLKARFMSDLSVFSEKDIIEGIKEIENLYCVNGTYTIEDEIIFISAYK